ncbi:dihydrofolate reductase [Candidatus Laterigemmans baculatus]|uniref:dihydrofolate reductase n=1 Tax=Candidatus Laterigemmans baculatus TaxID=2770505 RepID=UPI001F45D91F
MPWQLSSDLRRFKQLTLGHPIVMGRKTYESIGRPLPQRRNLVLSRSTAELGAGVEVFADIDSLLAAVADAGEVFVIGGATIYDALLPRCSRLLLTRVWTQTAGDTRLRVDLDAFRCVHVERHPQGHRDSVPTEFQIWERRPGAGNR